MHLHTLNFSGHFESDSDRSEQLQLAAPDNPHDREEIRRAILDDPEIVEADSARRDYEFKYELGEHIGDGLFALRVSASDASGSDHAVEITAGLAFAGTERPELSNGIPMWFISKRLGYRILGGNPLDYPGPSYGRLRLPDGEMLPQRRLFGARV